jgi:hypothetical protein
MRDIALRSIAPAFGEEMKQEVAEHGQRHDWNREYD